jgi:manganese-dependent inorganic pyrophosphatase
MPVYVIGHKNPDTDSICAAIAYARYLSLTHIPDAVAACCGEVNPRTQFVLSHAGIDRPRLIMDVRPTLGQVCTRQVITAQEDEAFFEVYHRMQARRLTALPVLDGAGRLTGMLSLSRLLELLLPDRGVNDSPRLVETSLDRICRALGGSFLHGVDTERSESLFLKVGAMSSGKYIPRLQEFPPRQSLIVVGDRPTIQQPTIDFGARCMVLTGDSPLAPELLEQARAKGVSVISSPWDTATTTMMIRGAKGIGPAIDRDCRTFKEQLLARAVLKELHGVRQNLFPVVDEAGNLAGVFSKNDLASPEQVRLVLVDHNELAQAVCGADEAEILEVLDHHRVGGGLMSREPIRFQNDTVGSTCTMVTRCFRRDGMVPAFGIGQCLAAGIISDTLNLSSPTTTPVDREMLGWLGSTCGFDVAAFAEAFFAVGSVLQLCAPREALRMDCKEYTEGPWRLAVAQIEEMGFQNFQQSRPALAAAMDDLLREQRLDFVALLVTDISLNNSLLLVAGNERVIEAIDYPRLDRHLFQLDAVVSRKKQLLPHLTRLLGRQEKDDAVPSMGA